MRSPTVRKALERYRRTVSILKKGYSQESFRIDQLQRSSLAEMLVSEVGSAHIARYRDERLAAVNPKTGRNLSPSSVRLEISLLSNFFELCKVEWAWRRDNPCANVRKPKPAQPRERRLTPREDRQIMAYAEAHANPSLYPIFVLALETGMRQGEILGIRWEYLDLKKRIIHLPQTKNGSKRDVPLSLKARSALIDLRRQTTETKREGRIFSYTSSGIKSIWHTMCCKLGIRDLHFHDLRHEAISRLFEKDNLDIMEIAAISGHKTLSQLKRYTHLKAHKLVRKLDGNNSRTKQVILSRLLPYPALAETTEEGVFIKLLDFDNLVVQEKDMPSARRAASHLLLNAIVSSILDDQTLPGPDEYLEPVDSGKVIMIEPLMGRD